MKNDFKILLVEDEMAIRIGLMDVLVYHGFAVDYADDGAIGLQKALSGQFDLVILDVMLPSMNGFDICEAIRQQDKQQPIIMLTAKTSDEDIIQGLSLGADDYIAKPFSVAQLVLRVKAVLRRSVNTVTETEIIQLDQNRKIDLKNLQIWIGDQVSSFTKREIQVIEYLYHHPDVPATRDELLHQVWGYPKNSDIETRTVDIHIAKIRKKIEVDAKQPAFLLTVRGAGYKLVCEGTKSNDVTTASESILTSNTAGAGKR
ncbi:MAG: response regulator transcription factor [Enterobacterales bacterium]|nr:response regulator transcription factor [Enterobacterales bacterium]